MISREVWCKSEHHPRIFLSSVKWFFFQFPCHVAINCKTIQSQVWYIINLMHDEPYDYNNEKYPRERCQKFLEFSGNMAIVVYVDEVGFNLHLARWFGRACHGQKCQWIHPTQRSRTLYLVIVVGHKGVITHDVTLGAYNTNKFLEFI